MKFEDDPLFRKPMKEAYLEAIGDTVHWIPPLSDQLNALTKLLGEDKTRQSAFERATYQFAAYADGKLRYRGNISLADFTKKADATIARDYGMLILGYSHDKKKADFDLEVDDEVKKSQPVKETSTG